MATITQLEIFETALERFFPDVERTLDGNYLRVEVCRPDDQLLKDALVKRLVEIATACAVVFEGFDENGYPCFNIGE